jgi:hypothetical protein
MAARRMGSWQGRPRPVPVYVLDAEEESDAEEADRN